MKLSFKASTGLRKLVNILQRFGLQHGVSKYVAVKVSLTDILEYSLHERDRNFSLLHEVIFRIFHLQARSLLLRLACILEPT